MGFSKIKRYQDSDQPRWRETGFFPRQGFFLNKTVKGFFPTRERVFPQNKKATDTDTEVQTKQGSHRKARGKPQDFPQKQDGRGEN